MGLGIAAALRRRGRREAVNSAYRAIVARAREPYFFTSWGVPDTLDGRFEVLALHAFLVLNRLKSERPATAEFAQDLFDTMFADLDRAVREMGATDLGVGRHVKAMARGFYGRIAAYEAGLAGNDAALEEALARNLFGTAKPTPAQLASAASYVRGEAAALRLATAARLLAGAVPFGAPPETLC
jgi:cytochrome b pre-mRNA-processing protein 3